jgi:hypothetical protein
MSTANIYSALMAGAKTILERAAVDGGLANPPVKWPGVRVTPPNGTFWVQVDLVPADTTPATVGLGGDDSATGFLQFTLNHPKDKGTGAAWAAGDKLRNFFSTGSSFKHDITEVKITRAHVAQPLPKESCLTTYVTIYYTSRIKRPSSPTTSP